MSLAKQRANICAAWTFSSSECVASQIRLWQKMVTCYLARIMTSNNIRAFSNESRRERERKGRTNKEDRGIRQRG